MKLFVLLYSCLLNVGAFFRKNALPMLALGLALVMGAPDMLASTDPVADVNGAATTAQTAWAAFAAISASAFIFAMVIGYGRKGKK